MKHLPRHQCLIYDGSPAQHLPALAAVIRQKLADGERCLYLNSPPMVAGIRSYLAAAGIDVEHALADGSLVLSSTRDHLVENRFDIERMMGLLDGAVADALANGYRGLWATGDMSWELGPHWNLAQLVDYEWRLENFFQGHPALGGICQYHADTLPRAAMCQGLAAHPTIFVNDTLARLNPHYLPHASAALTMAAATARPELGGAVDQLCQPRPRDA